MQREKLSQLKEQFKDVNENNLLLAKMERKRAALEESYKKFSENLQQARIDQSLKLEKNIQYHHCSAADLFPAAPQD